MLAIAYQTFELLRFLLCSLLQWGPWCEGHTYSCLQSDSKIWWHWTQWVQWLWFLELWVTRGVAFPLVTGLMTVLRRALVAVSADSSRSIGGSFALSRCRSSLGWCLDTPAPPQRELAERVNTSRRLQSHIATRMIERLHVNGPDNRGMVSSTVS